LTSGERRKIEFTNWSFELRFIYDFALAPSPFSVPAVTPFAVERRRLAVVTPAPPPAAPRVAPLTKPALAPSV